MKITKILSAVTAVAAAATMAVSASANYAPVSGAQSWVDTSSNQNFMVTLYSADGVDFGIDIAALDSVTYTFTFAEPEYIDGNVGGWIGSSWHNTTLYPEGSDVYNAYNWVTGGEFWGITDDALTDAEGNPMDTQAAAGKPTQTVKVGEYTYSVTEKVVNPLANGDMESLELVRIFMSEWGAVMSETVVTQIDFNDADGNVMLSMDGLGNVIAGGGDTGSAGGDDASGSEGGSAAAGDVNAPTTAKQSPDTGVEGVAAVAGLAVVAAGAVVLSKKRK